MPTFGRSTIRRFHANVSAMKKLAARDFEDILQVHESFMRMMIHMASLEWPSLRESLSPASRKACA